jgi:hypothetical protein
VVLCLSLIFGVEIGGSKNWLVLGPISVQPSEFGKILLVLFLAAFLSDHGEMLKASKRKILFLDLPPIRFIAPLLVIWGIAILMFVVQRDLGSALLFFCMAVFMTYMGTGSKSYVFIALLFFAALYLFTAGYRYGLVVNIIRWIGKLPGLKKWSRSFSERHAEALQHIDEQIAALHRQDKKAFYNSLLLEYLSRILQSSEVFFMLILFGIDCGGGVGGLCLTYLHSLLVVALTSFLANLIGFLPMQIGVQEGGFVISIAALGLSAALGIFVSIICRVREIIWIIVGIALMKVINEKSPAST